MTQSIRKNRQQESDIPIWKQVVIGFGFAIAGFLLFGGILHATAYYCSPTGSWITGDGTYENQWGSVTAVNPTTVKTTASSGDTLVVADYGYGSVTINGLDIELVIISETEYGARMPRFFLYNCDSLTVEAFDIDPWASGSYIGGYYAVGEASSSNLSTNITYKNLRIRQAASPWTTVAAWQDSATWYGIRVRSDGARIIDCIIHQTNMAIFSTGQVYIDGNDINGFADDGIHLDGTGTNGSTIINNTIKNCYDVNAGVHTDHIQIVHEEASNIEIGWNICIVQDATHTLPSYANAQGICNFVAAGYNSYDLHVHHNIVKNDGPHGITLYNALRAKVYNNVCLEDGSNGSFVPGLSVTSFNGGTCDSCIVFNNSAISVTLTGTNFFSGNNYDFDFGDQSSMVVDWSGNDLRLATGATAIDYGSVDSLLAHITEPDTLDILGNAPSGDDIDAWVYEYDGASPPEEEGGDYLEVDVWYIGDGNYGSATGRDFTNRITYATVVDSLAGDGEIDTLLAFDGILVDVDVDSVIVIYEEAVDADGRTLISSFENFTSSTPDTITIEISDLWTAWNSNVPTWNSARGTSPSNTVSTSADYIGYRNDWDMYHTHMFFLIPDSLSTGVTGAYFELTIQNNSMTSSSYIFARSAWGGQATSSFGTFDGYNDSTGVITGTDLIDSLAVGSGSSGTLQPQGTDALADSIMAAANDTLQIIFFLQQEIYNVETSAIDFIEVEDQFNATYKPKLKIIINGEGGGPDPTDIVYKTITETQANLQRAFNGDTELDYVADTTSVAQGYYTIFEGTKFVVSTADTDSVVIGSYKDGLTVTGNEVSVEGDGLVTIQYYLDAIDWSGSDGNVSGIINYESEVAIRSSSALITEHMTSSQIDSAIHANQDQRLNIWDNINNTDSTGVDADSTVFNNALVTDGTGNIEDDPEFTTGFEPTGLDWIGDSYPGAVYFDQTNLDISAPTTLDTLKVDEQTTIYLNMVNIDSVLIKIKYGLSGAFEVLGTVQSGIDSLLWTPDTPTDSLELVAISLPDSAVSDTVRYIPVRGWITVTNPNGGENYRYGESVTITWTDTSVTNVKIEWTPDNGSNWITIVNSTISDGSYSWNAPDTTTSSQGYIRITDVYFNDLTDQSNSGFTITDTSNQPSILTRQLIFDIYGIFREEE